MSAEGHTKEGKGKEEAYTDRFERMQEIEGRQRARVTVFWRSADFSCVKLL